MIIIYIIIIGLIGFIIKRSNERILINIILSKLDFRSKYNKITRNANIISINTRDDIKDVKCEDLILEELIKQDCYDYKYRHYNKNGSIIDIEFDGFKVIKTADILIDLIKKQYKIIISVIHITIPINDKNNLMNEIISILKKPSYYIIKSYIDNNLNLTVPYYYPSIKK